MDDLWIHGRKGDLCLFYKIRDQARFVGHDLTGIWGGNRLVVVDYGRDPLYLKATRQGKPIFKRAWPVMHYGSSHPQGTDTSHMPRVLAHMLCPGSESICEVLGRIAEDLF